MDLKALRNDKERIAFLEDYTNEGNGWKLWKGDTDLQRRMWRYDLPDCMLVVEEEKTTIIYPKEQQEWIARNWYIAYDMSGAVPFADYRASRTMALFKIKEITKRI